MLAPVTDFLFSARPYATLSPLAPVFEPHPSFTAGLMVLFSVIRLVPPTVAQIGRQRISLASLALVLTEDWTVVGAQGEPGWHRLFVVVLVDGREQLLNTQACSPSSPLSQSEVLPSAQPEQEHGYIASYTSDPL